MSKRPCHVPVRLAAGLLAGTVLTGCSATDGDVEGLQGRIEGVRPADGGVDVNFYAEELPADAELRPAGLTVLLDGQPVPAAAATAGERSGEDLRRVVLVLDTSGSMEGERLSSAKAAARAYLEAIPADVEAGLVTFADSPNLAVPPTRDRAAVLAVVDQLVAANGTSLYDAVVTGQQSLGSIGERRLVVLSDGADTSSRASVGAAASAIRGAGVQLDSVALEVEDSAMPAVKQLAEAGGGQVLRAEDALETTVAFRSVAGAFSKRLRVHVPVAPELAGMDLPLSVAVQSTAGAVTAESALALPGMRAPGFWGSSTALLLGLGAALTGTIGFLALLLGVGPSRGEQRQRTQALLASYTLTATRRAPDSADERARWGGVPGARPLAELAGKLVDQRRAGERLAIRLDRAAVRLTVGEWLVLHVGVALLATGIGVAVDGILWGVLAGVLAATGLHLWLSQRAKRRTTAFTEGMPDALQLVASGLATGYSLPQALDAAVREGQEPIAGELGRALAEARLGVSLEDALDGVADRMDSKDFRWVVMAIRVQRGVGGNLAEVLSTVCATMRDRAALRRQVAALSAEGRLSAYVLIGLPILMGLFQLLFRRAYFEPMLTRPIGIVLLVVSALSLAVGGLVMKKMVKVEM